MEYPESVRELLWEVDVEDPDVAERLDRVVVERVMERGGWQAMQWLLGAHGRGPLRQYLEARGCRVLPPRELRFWSWVCGVPEPLASSWVSQARTREQAWWG